jgi:Anaphase-promoting complex, subunit 10 (APC10)
MADAAEADVPQAEVTVTPATMTPSTLPNTREVGNEALWQVSSAKPLSGVDQLRDDNLETYWQSGK